MKGAGFDDSTNDGNQYRPVGKSWFLGIGINEYQDTQKFRKLQNAVKDVEDIGKLLYEHYIFDTSKLLLDQEATRTAIINTLFNLAEELKKDDKLLVYFSGHGYKEILNTAHSLAFWVPVDAKAGDISSVISNDEIIKYLSVMQARHIFLISDSCYSGTFLQSRASIQKKANISRAKKLESLKSRLGLFSGRDDQTVCDGNPGENSPFASAILSTLSQHENRFINAGLFVEKVAEQAKRNANGQDVAYNPIPGCGDNNGQYIFWCREEKKTMPVITSGKIKKKIEAKSIPFPAYPTDRRLTKNIPLITESMLDIMEKNLRQTCELMLKELKIPLRKDQWALRDYCINKAHVTIDLLNEVQTLKDELDELSLSSGSLFDRVVDILNKFTGHLDSQHFQFIDTAGLAELSRFISNPIEETAFQLKESKCLVKQAYTDDPEQKNILKNRLSDTFVQLQLLYLILEKVVSATGQHKLRSPFLN